MKKILILVALFCALALPCHAQDQKKLLQEVNQFNQIVHNLQVEIASSREPEYQFQELLTQLEMLRLVAPAESMKSGIEQQCTIIRKALQRARDDTKIKNSISRVDVILKVLEVYLCLPKDDSRHILAEQLFPTICRIKEELKRK